LTNSERAERGGSRFESKSSSQGFARPRIESAIITAAAVPFVMPHLLKPVAVWMWGVERATRPTYGTWSCGM
jgi:hypothetical protein